MRSEMERDILKVLVTEEELKAAAEIFVLSVKLVSVEKLLEQA